MNWLDLFIVLFLLAAIIRGSEVGFVRQFFSTTGFLGGLLLGAWLQTKIISAASTPSARALLAFLVTVSFGLLLMAVGEYVGLRLKFRLREAELTNKLDRIFGSVVAVVTLLATVWLGASIFRNLPDGGWQRQIRNSRIVTLLDNNLPSAPEVVTRLGHLIDPNNFPQVFAGLEPQLKTDAPLPDLGDLNAVVQKARPSVVKVEGEGCNAVVEGSGFVAGDGAVVTNAHVVAGVRKPFILDQAGRHGAKVVLFDPNLDLAILRAENLAGPPLLLDSKRASTNTPVAVLGYPSGAGFTVRPGVILEIFTAKGRNIYNESSTTREVYSVKTNIGHGNSGGPMIDENGRVVGVIFANSINYSGVGYALTMQAVIDNLHRAVGQTEAVATGNCAG